MKLRFFNIINSSKLVLVDFYADWCIPCKELVKNIEKVKKEVREVRIVKVDVDRNPFLASHFNISSVPTIILFKKGEKLWTGTGVHSADEIKKVLSRH